MKSNFRVLGAGVWGLAFSDYLYKLGHNVEVFCRDTNLKNKKLNDIDLKTLSGIKFKSFDELDKHESSDAINIMAVNSKGFDNVLVEHKKYFQGVKQLVSLTKGIDHGTGLLFHSLVEERINSDIKYGLISGPSFAIDLVNKKRISVSFACCDNDLVDKIVTSTESSYFNMIPISEIHHIEIAGIIKNIAAILCGMADSIFDKGVYTNEIIKRASDETWKMSSEALAYDKSKYNEEKYLNSEHQMDKETIIKSPGYVGDMILTCKQNQSRNYQFGKAIADIHTNIEEAKNNIGTVEGYECCITLEEKSPFATGDLTKLLYKIIKCDDTSRVRILKSFLQV